MKQFLTRLWATFHYVSIACLFGMLFGAGVTIIAQITSYVYANYGIPGALVTSFTTGALLISAYQAIRIQLRKQEALTDVVAQSLTNADITRYLATPEGVELAYKIITERAKGRKPLASAHRIARNRRPVEAA